jgi:hypothetical protein
VLSEEREPEIPKLVQQILDGELVEQVGPRAWRGRVHAVGTEHPHKPNERRYVDITGPFSAEMVGRDVEIRVLPRRDR